MHKSTTILSLKKHKTKVWPGGCLDNLPFFYSFFWRFTVSAPSISVLTRVLDDSCSIFQSPKIPNQRLKWFSVMFSSLWWARVSIGWPNMCQWSFEYRLWYIYIYIYNLGFFFWVGGILSLFWNIFNLIIWVINLIK